jgi:hypothetical protein
MDPNGQCDRIKDHEHTPGVSLHEQCVALLAREPQLRHACPEPVLFISGQGLYFIERPELLTQLRQTLLQGLK